jgi:hypothetical protein
MTLGDKALAEVRPFHAAPHFRSAEFHMTSDDPRKHASAAAAAPSRGIGRR